MLKRSKFWLVNGFEIYPEVIIPEEQGVQQKAEGINATIKNSGPMSGHREIQLGDHPDAGPAVKLGDHPDAGPPVKLGDLPDLGTGYLSEMARGQAEKQKLQEFITTEKVTKTGEKDIQKLNNTICKVVINT